MPKKIKEEKNLYESKKEKLINVDNIHIVFIALAVLVLCICIGVGTYVYLEDKSHPNKDNAIVEFYYAEVLNEGYNVFIVRETDAKRVFLEHNTLDIQDVKEIGRGKYLDFNEDVYNSGLLDRMTVQNHLEQDYEWRLSVKYADGTTKYVYSSDAAASGIDMTVISNLISKYFKEEIRSK